MKREELGTLIYNCPFCEEKHEIIKIQYQSKAIVKDEEVEYSKQAYFCPQNDAEFEPSDIADSNLTAAREAYRIQQNYLTIADIKRIRSKYDLTQKEYARLLGVGDATIQRYETKAIQDNTYDNLMRLTDENPTYSLVLLEKNRHSFDAHRYEQIKRAIIYQINIYGEDFFLESAIRASYTNYLEESKENGYTVLNIEKIKKLLVYFSTYVPSLYKVKLMKLLWYTDAEAYKQFGHSITGLVYQHMPLGAVPIAHDKLMGLSCISVEEEEHDLYVAYKILPASEVNISGLSLDELRILQKITDYFKNFTTKEIVNYMHGENAYSQTNHKDIIEFTPENLIHRF
uniref:type II TA system antitoxin MqsA family protein n=1 Tax=Acetatifactor sp. TaxID=1872090 RepID=UPI0040573591